MKKKLLGLGVCALALGAFAGAVSAQRALETNAALPVTVYVDVSALNWFGDASAKAYAYVFNDDHSIKNADYPGAEMESVSEGLYSVAIPSGATKLAILRMNPADLTESGIWNKSADIALEADKDYLTITALGNGTSTSAWSIKGDGYRLVGLGSFDYKDSIASEETENNDKFKKTNLALEAGNKFKISFADTEAKAIKWGENYGYSALEANGAEDAKGNFEADGDDNIVVKEGKGGNYDIYLNSAGKIFIFEHAEPVPDVYSVFLDGAEKGNLTENPNNPGEYMISDLDLVAGEELVIKLNGEKLNVGVKTGGENNVALNNGKLLVRMSGEGGIYLSQVDANWVVWVDGYLTSDHEAVDGFVATYITPYIDDDWEGQTEDVRKASCQEKYQRAQPHYEALTQDQKDLFNANARYGTAKTAYKTWEAVAGNGGAFNVNTMSMKDNTPLIITLVALGAAAAIGVSIFFATRKKHN